MPSSKFNRRPVPKRRPAICIAPRKPPLPFYEKRRPPNLYAFVRWMDDDPAGAQDAGAAFYTRPRTGAGTYTGRLTVGVVTIGILVIDHWPTPTVDVRLLYEDPTWGLITHAFPTVDMPLDEPFNTRLLTTRFPIGIDYRRAWAAE